MWTEWYNWLFICIIQMVWNNDGVESSTNCNRDFLRHALRTGKVAASSSESYAPSAPRPRQCWHGLIVSGLFYPCCLFYPWLWTGGPWRLCHRNSLQMISLIQTVRAGMPPIMGTATIVVRIRRCGWSSYRFTMIVPATNCSIFVQGVAAYWLL